ncbi:MAG: hypothetical protein K2L45_09605 [Muribaculaceae bacterium]|nr:hypothetical protein [Muribaculaceae bacterium]
MNEVNDIVREDGITFRCSDMLYSYQGEDSFTRASAPKSEDEKRINTLHIFFFRDDENGELMKTTNYDNFSGYMKRANEFLKVPTPPSGQRLFVDGDDVPVRIVAIANIDATDAATDANDAYNSFCTEYSTTGKIARASRDKDAPEFKITKYKDLLDWVYYPRLRINEDTGLGDIRHLPAAGMPMIGELRNVKLSEKKPYVVDMEALMAKIFVRVELKPDQYKGDLPEITIDEVGVMNMPTAVPYTPPTGKMNNGKDVTTPPVDYYDYMSNYDVTTVSMVHPGTERDDEGCAPELHEYTAKLETPLIVNRKTDPAVLSYYTYENIQLPDYNAKRANNVPVFDGLTAKYPDDVKEEDKQRWKSTMAYKNRASALILKGTFTTHQGVDYHAKFTVFMGGNEKDDFMVKRNHRYDNNITIYGLEYMRNSDDEVFNFDGRLNVVSDNPIYLGVVNERKLDAHATALPVDVWLMMWENANNQADGDPNVNWRSEVTLSINEPNTHKWIRMDRVVPRSEMEGSGWKAGTGARPWFTTTLMDELSSKTSLTIKSDEHGSRSRVYFYIDENVPTKENLAAGTYSDREATINVHYARYDKSTNALVEDKDYTLDIEQRALVKVSGQRAGRTDDKENVPDTWMEYYEEYLTHNDPLDQRSASGEFYDGLKWGPKNFNCRDHWSSEKVYRKKWLSSDYRNYKETCTYNEVYGCEGAIPMNAWMVNIRGGIENVKLFNDDAPDTAFHYAYGKNKRDSEGKVPNTISSRSSGWYLPGIRELEAAITQYYTDFTDFQGNFYWSAAPAEESSNNVNDHARATKVKSISGNTAQYEESGTSSPHPGFKVRDEICRIRVFYKPAE